MQICCAHEKMGRPDAVVFDFDGTLSKLRAGWEGVMAPLMCECIPGDPTEIRALVERYIDESTGIQTIFQMRWLAEQVTARGKTALDPWDYKAEYNRRLMQEVARRRAAILNGTESAEKYCVPGGRAFLTALQALGVPMFAASGTDEADVQAEAQVLGFDGFFREISGAVQGTDRCSKEAALRKLMRPGQKVLVVGDGKVEIALGRETGALTLGIASLDAPGEVSKSPDDFQMQKYHRLKAAGAHAIVADFAETKEILSWI